MATRITFAIASLAEDGKVQLDASADGVAAGTIAVQASAEDRAALQVGRSYILDLTPPAPAGQASAERVTRFGRRTS